MLSQVVKPTQFGIVAKQWELSKHANHFDVPVYDEKWDALIENAIVLLNDNQFDDALKSLLKIFIFRIANSPLSVNHPDFWPFGDKETFFHELESVERSTSSPAAAAILAILRELGETKEHHPIFNAVRQLATTLPKNPIILFQRKRLQLESRILLLSVFQKANVITQADYYRVAESDVLLIIGPPFAYSEVIIDMPRVPTYWIHLDRYQGPSTAKTFLQHSVKFRKPVRIEKLLLHGNRRSGTSTTRIHNSEIAPIDWQDIASDLLRSRQIDRESQDSFYEESVEAVGIEVGENSIVFLAWEERSPVFIPEMHEIRNIEGKNLTAGMYVILRKNEGRDYIRDLVESKFLKNAQSISYEIQKWKHSLRDKIRQLGINTVVEKLRPLGVREAEQTVRTWATDLVYGPGSKTSFFALMELLAVESSAEQWKYVEAYRKAGLSAGKYVSSQLRAQIVGMDPKKIIESDKITFSLDGIEGQKLIAHRIEGVKPEKIEVPTHLLNQIIREGVEPWR